MWCMQERREFDHYKARHNYVVAKVLHVPTQSLILPITVSFMKPTTRKYLADTTDRSTAISEYSEIRMFLKPKVRCLLSSRSAKKSLMKGA